MPIFYRFAALLSVGLFIHALLKPREIIHLEDWSRQSCRFEHNRQVVDLNCRHHFAIATSLAQPYLNYGEKLECLLADSPAAKALPSTHPAKSAAPELCAHAPSWGTNAPLYEIGWDAQAIWYARAAELYWQSQHPGWPGTWAALQDPNFTQAVWPNVEHHHYPWLVPVIYASVMRALHSPSPFALRGLQMALWFFCAFLFYRCWPRAPKSLWLIFACAPIGAKFFYALYADLWVIAGLLSLFWGLEKKSYLLAAASAAIAIQLKQEAWLQVTIFLLSYFLLYRAQLRSWKQQPTRILAITVGAACLSYLWLRHSALSLESTEFYVPLSRRLLEKETYLVLLPKLAGYYLDVIFRPSLWGLLWPLCAYSFFRARRYLGAALLPLLSLLAIVPLAFLRFPFGHKEVFLTGANRAFWQMLPLLWLLLKAAHENSVTQPTCSARLPESRHA